MRKNKKFIAATMAAVMMVTPFSSWDLKAFAAQSENQSSELTKENTKEMEEDATSYITEGMIDTKNYDYLTLNEEMEEEEMLYEREEVEVLEELLGNSSSETVLEDVGTEFPSSVDWSTSEYFPEVGNQGSSGSCWHYGTIYASMTFSNNKERGIPASESNTINPIFGYNYAQRTKTIQIDLANQIGYPSIEVLPIDTKQLTSLFPTKEVWESALLNRGGEMISVNNFGEEDEVVTGPKDTSLNSIKQILNDGKVIAVGSYSYNWNKSVVPLANLRVKWPLTVVI